MIGHIIMLSASTRSPGVNVIDALVGASLAEIRLRAGISQQELADQLDMTVSDVQSWESGQMHIAARDLILLSRALNVSVGEFWAKL